MSDKEDNLTLKDLVDKICTSSGSVSRSDISSVCRDDSLTLWNGQTANCWKGKGVVDYVCDHETNTMQCAGFGLGPDEAKFVCKYVDFVTPKIGRIY